MSAPGVTGAAFGSAPITLSSWPGAMYYVVADDAVADGAGKASSCPDRVASRNFAQAASGSRYAILAAGGTHGLAHHKTLDAGASGKSLALQSFAISGLLEGNPTPAFTFAIYMNSHVTNDTADLISHNDTGVSGGNNFVRFTWQATQTGGTRYSIRGGGGLDNVQTAFTKTIDSFASYILSYDGAGTATTYYNGVSKGTSSYSGATAPTTLQYVTLGTCRGYYHQWFGARGASSSTSVSTLHALMVAAAA